MSGKTAEMPKIVCKTHPCRAWCHRSLILLITVLFSSLCVEAQEHSQYDRGTPPQHAAGISSLGSYTSADIGNINLANGALNFKLPLGEVGGRGVSLPITLNYGSKMWSASRGSDWDNSQDPPHGPVERKVVYGSYAEADYGLDYYNRLVPGWTIGAQPLLRARMIEIGHFPNSCVPAYKLTRLTLVLPDKGEVELRDDQTNGAPIPVPSNSGCGYRDGYRGPRWHAADGSGLIFVADSNNGPVQGFLAGVVITSDGTRYRFEDGPGVPYGGTGLARCHSITDRHGNRITITYPNDEVHYSDPLGRVTKVQRGVPDPANPSVNLDLLVTLPGYGGQPRYYKVKLGIMNQHYRAGINPSLPVGTGRKDCEITPHGYDQMPMGTALFPNSWGKYVTYIDHEGVVSELVLPDGRSLHFKYNEHGEVAEVQLPTGGKVQYDYGPTALPAGNTLNWEKAASGPNMDSSVWEIDRALLTRRTYPDGSTLEATWVYSYGGTGTVAVAAYSGSSGQLLLSQKHYFLAAFRYLALQFEDPDGSGYNLWSTGLEYRTETLDASGAIISASEQDWSQRVPLVWSTGYQQEQPENDNRVNEERRILETGQTARSTFLYDQFNNATETSEFDFDSALKRRTVTSYSSANLVNGLNYADDSIRLIRLPLQQSVYDGADVEQARTIYEYDIYTGDGNHDYLLSYGPVTGHDTANYGLSRMTRGNVTRIGNWIKSTNSFLYNYPRYDIPGNVVFDERRQRQRHHGQLYGRFRQRQQSGSGSEWLIWGDLCLADASHQSAADTWSAGTDRAQPV